LKEEIALRPRPIKGFVAKKIKLGGASTSGAVRILWYTNNLDGSAIDAPRTAENGGQVHPQTGG
jgi:hypothetical protein